MICADDSIELNALIISAGWQSSQADSHEGCVIELTSKSSSLCIIIILSKACAQIADCNVNETCFLVKSLPGP